MFFAFCKHLSLCEFRQVARRCGILSEFGFHLRERQTGASLVFFGLASLTSGYLTKEKSEFMRFRMIGLLAGAALLAVLGTAPKATAQISVGVNVGPPPNCPYGYFDYAPYNCAPYGYYGPEWFTNGVFIGAGPWFHGPAHFRGHVDNHFDPHHGYHGHLPARGEHRDVHNRVDHMEHFHGNEMRDGHGSGRR